MSHFWIFFFNSEGQSNYSSTEKFTLNFLTFTKKNIRKTFFSFESHFISEHTNCVPLYMLLCVCFYVPAMSHQRAYTKSGKQKFYTVYTTFSFTWHRIREGNKTWHGGTLCCRKKKLLPSEWCKMNEANWTLEENGKRQWKKCYWHLSHRRKK